MKEGISGGSLTGWDEVSGYALNALRRFKYRSENTAASCEKAIKWLKDNTIARDGIAVSSKKRIPYPEVTGYTIPTLCQWGEKEMAGDLALCLTRRQNPDGSFSAVDGTPYTFDTAQVMRGFLAVLDDIPEIKAALIKGCDWITAQARPDGSLSTPSTTLWGGRVDERVHLYVLPVLIEAARRLGRPQYEDAAKRAVEYYRTVKGLVEFNTMSHFYGYILDGLCDLREDRLARSGFKNISVLQGRHGGIPAYKNVSWVCLPGAAQLAIVGYKLGEIEFSDKAVDYLVRAQNASGGFCGSRGWWAGYYPNEEISWAAKFFLDAYHWRIKTSFDKEVDRSPSDIDKNDGRMKEILRFLGDISGKKVIDVGCGRGRYLKILKSLFPAADLYGLDLSERALSSCPKGIITSCEDMFDIKYADASFDLVYSVEALEHAPIAENAIREMARILKPGGRIMIIDKDADKAGALKPKPWERWFGADEVVRLLAKYGVKAAHRHIDYVGSGWPPGLFIAWDGVKDVRFSG